MLVKTKIKQGQRTPAKKTTTTTTTTTTSSAQQQSSPPVQSSTMTLDVGGDRAELSRKRSKYTELVTLTPLTEAHVAMEERSISVFETFKSTLMAIQKLNQESARLLSEIRKKQDEMRALQADIVELERQKEEIDHKRKQMLADARNHFMEFSKFMETTKTQTDSAHAGAHVVADLSLSSVIPQEYDTKSAEHKLEEMTKPVESLPTYQRTAGGGGMTTTTVTTKTVTSSSSSSSSSAAAAAAAKKGKK